MPQPPTRRQHHRHRAAALLLTVWLCVVVTAQNRTLIPPVGETIEVSIVNVDVVVTDRNGNHIHGLTKNDFDIYEDGKLQPVSNFAEYTGGKEASPPTVAASEVPAPAPGTSRAPRPKRTILVFLDHVAQLSPEKELFFASLKKLLHETIGPGDVVSVVSWKKMLVTRLPFTQDLAALDAVLGKLEAESISHFPDADVHSLFFNVDVEGDRLWRDELMAIASAQGFKLNYSEIEGQSGPEAARYETVEMRKKLHAIQSVVTALSGFEGRKILVLAVNHLSLVNGESREGTGRGSAYDMYGSIEGLGRIAATNNITIYPMFLLGPVKFVPSPILSAEHPPFEEDTEANELFYPSEPFKKSPVNGASALAAMVPIARRTGGRVSVGARSFAAMVPRITEDLDSYYSLAFRATASGSGADHTVLVKMKNPEYVARYRRDYVDRPPVAKMKDRVVASLYQEPGGSTISISVKAGPARKYHAHSWIVPIHVEIPIASLTTLHQKSASNGAFSVYVAWRGILGELSEADRQTRSFTIPDAKQRGPARDHFDYDFPLEVDDRTRGVVIGVVDEVSQEFGIQTIELPPRS